MLVVAEFRVLGAVETHVDGHPVDLGSPRQRGVLAVLLLHANHPVPVDQFLDHVWGEHLPQRGRNALYSYVSRLRAILAPIRDVSLQRRSSGYRLTVDEAAVDVHRFRQLTAEARASAEDVDALTLFDRALGLWRGPALAGLDSPWIASVRTTLEAERWAAELDRTDAALRCGRHAELLADLITHATQQPLDERLAAQAMLALYRSGRQADALQHYDHMRKELAEQLGVDPNPALQQLHQRILAADVALAARVVTPRATPRQLPPAPAGFTGRVTELDALTSSLDSTDGDTVLISTLTGPGGIGKTWLALTWAHRNMDRFPDGQLSVDLHGFSPDVPKHPADVLADFLAALGVDRDHQPTNLDARIALYRTRTTDKRMLILLDNAATTDQIEPLLPGGTTCSVLVTSRHRLPALTARHGARPVRLDVLAGAEARTLLVAALGDAHDHGDTERAVIELIGLCKGFPLALGLVAARIRDDPDLLDDLVADLRELGLEALDSEDAAASLPTVLSWSLRNLTDHQRTVFGLLGIAPGPDTTLPAVVSLSGLSQAAARRTLSALEDASLLERRPGGRYAMHDLVRDYSATTADTFLPADVRDTALTRVMDFYLHTAHTAERLLDPHRTPLRPGRPAAGVHPLSLSDAAAAMDWLEDEHATLLAAQRAGVALGRHDLVWHLAWDLEIFHLRRGHRHDALAAWRAALHAAAHLPDPVTRLRAHRLLGSACSRLGLHDEAVEHLAAALELATHHQDLTEQAHAHWVLASTWERQEDDRRALEHARHALNLYRLLDRPVWEADALNAVGWYGARLGEFDTARDHCHAALTLYRHHPYPTGEAATLDSLAFIAHQTGDHQQALDLYDQALTLYRSLGDTVRVADTLGRLGWPHVALGQHDRARAVWREAIELHGQQGRDTDAARVHRQLDALDQHPASR
ncbi:SARP family transcriptional regulator [Kutzneria sp. CA-103260]|nr:SARP family transcriptional regulator [Kutzneria sp. CA-103260]